MEYKRLTPDPSQPPAPGHHNQRLMYNVYAIRY